MNHYKSPFQTPPTMLKTPKSWKKIIERTLEDWFFFVVKAAKEIDLLLFSTIVILFIISITMCFVSTFNVSKKDFGDPYFMAFKHIRNLSVSFGMIILFLFVRVEKIYQYPFTLYTLCVAMLSAVFLEGLGQEAAGAKRWIFINNISFQPSELVKFFLFFILSQQIAKLHHEKNVFRGKIFPAFFVLSSLCGLIVLEPDLSTASIIFLSGFALFLHSSVNLMHILSTLVFLLPFGILFLQSKRYYLSRFIFFNPNLDPQGRGYHLSKSFKVFRYGKINGNPINETIMHLSSLPDAHNDFIFSVVGNLFGIVGILLIEILFIIIILRGLVIAERQQNKAHYYLCMGFTYLLGAQSTLHMLVTTGLIPTTGITLPFLSYGGSALVVNGMIVGTILRFSRQSVIKNNTL